MLVQTGNSTPPTVKKCSECDEVKPVGDLYLRGDRKGLRPKCKPCHRAESKQRWHSDQSLRDRNYDGWLRRTYGMSLDDYNALAESQGWVCAICGHDPKTLHANKSRQAQRLYVDHCHTTGQIRGLLCFKCNRKIAPFESNEDWLQRALIYLQLLESADTLDTDPSKLLDN